MKKPSAEYIAAYYRQTRRENFAASQRLEGIFTEATVLGKSQPSESRAALKLRYAKVRAAR